MENLDIKKYSEVYGKLLFVQQNLKAPKNRRASFGGKAGYNYRSCEDILNAVKPLMKEAGLIITLTDEIVDIGGFNYIKATARAYDVVGTGAITTTAYAKEAIDKKGMDVAQMTGSASSYARKYALNGLFAIDDSEDIDSMDHSEKKTTTRAAKPQAIKQEEPKEEAKPAEVISEAQARRMYAISGGNKELCVKVIGKYGYKSSKEIKWEDYEAICDEIVEARGEE